MSRFKVGDRAKFVKSDKGMTYQSQYYIGRKGIVIEVDDYVEFEEGEKENAIRIAYTDGTIRNVKDRARNAIHY